MVVLSLGGSLILKDTWEIDVKLIRKLRDLIEKYKEYRFIVVCGGGRIARLYQKAARKFNVKSNQLDYIGIAATRLNGELIKAILNAEIVDLKCKKLKNRVAVSFGFDPGHSTDYNAIILAKNFGEKEVINLTNVDYVYDKDPKLKGAKPIKEISFDEYMKIVGDKWIPGRNVPFDPIAAKLAKKFGIKVIILNGRNIKNLEKCLKKEKFVGTILY